MSNKIKLLFFPSDLGGGFGHISRCLAIAHEAKYRGHKCAFVINDKKYEKRLKNDFNIFVSKKHYRWLSTLRLLKNNIFGKKSHITPLFTEISGLDYQVLRDGFINDAITRYMLNQYVEIVRSYKPDVLVGDTNLLVWMTSQKVKVPVVQIVRLASHPQTAKLIWWKDKSEGLIPPKTSFLFNPLLSEIGLEPINRAEDLLQGDYYIVPSIQEIEPIPEDGKTAYVGDLTISTRNMENPSWLKEIDDKLPLVYITIGGGAGPVGNNLFFSTIIKAFAGNPINVIVSTSNKFNPSDFPNTSQNIRFYKWVPGKLMISRADLVIFHGGYSTMMETVTCGKPTIITPFQTEQEGNGRRLEMLGCGRVIKLSSEDYKKIEGQWKYGTYSFLVQNRFDLTSGKLYREVDNLLNDNECLSNAQGLQSKIIKYRGAEGTMELIEKHWG